MKIVLLLLALLLLAVGVYLPGLSGDFMFDDLANLAPVEKWAAGELAWREVVFTNHSGPLGRSFSMLSFLANVAVLDTSAWSLKLGNLLIHLVVGVLLFLFIRMLASRDSHFAPHGQWLALALTALWLLHPMMVSTVLYVVQRMAMLSALFILAAMLAYLYGRVRIEAGNRRSGTLWLFIAVPLLTTLAALSKENGLLAPLLCGVLEWVYFAPKQGRRRPWQARLFVAAGIAFPVVGAVLLFVVHPEFFLAGFDNRPFGPVERVMTQSRVLFDYIGGLLLPVGSSFSLFRDDYVVSQSLFTPWTTALAWLAWIVIAWMAVALRRSIPGFSAGVGIFIVGHGMESSIFPLLIYFEHRNYLPSIGLLIALASLFLVGGRWAAERMRSPRPIFVSATILILIVMAAATHARAWVWQSNELLARQSLEKYPDSRFMRMEMATIEMNKGPEGVPIAREHYRYLSDADRASSRFIGEIAQIAVDCFSDQKTKVTEIDHAFSIEVEAIESDVEKAIMSLADIIQSRNCKNLGPHQLGSKLSSWLDLSSLDPGVAPIWRLRYQIARLYLAAGQPERALKEANRAWTTGKAELPVGMLIAGLNVQLGNEVAAQKILDSLELRIPKTDRTGRMLLEEYRERLAKKKGPNNVGRDT